MTGVQTCALPIFHRPRSPPHRELLPPDLRPLLAQRSGDDEGDEEERGDPAEPAESLKSVGEVANLLIWG